MKIFEILHVDGKPHIFKDTHNEEPGLVVYGKDPNHFTPAKIINEYLGQEIVFVYGQQGPLVHLFIPEKHMELWSDKIGRNKDFLWIELDDGTFAIRLDKMQELTK